MMPPYANSFGEFAFIALVAFCSLVGVIAMVRASPLPEWGTLALLVASALALQKYQTERGETQGEST